MAGSIMTSAISTNYRELAPSEVAQVAEECAKAWQDPEIPRRQYELAVKPELDKYRNGQPVAPFDAMIRCMRQIPLQFTGSRSKLLDVGASSGYTKELLRIAGYYLRYKGADFSPEFKKLAEELYPGIEFDIVDARHLPDHDDSHTIVLSGAVLMHVLEYPQVIMEASRVASEYVIFHRTPVNVNKPTSYWKKEAYGIPVLEIFFNEAELVELFRKNFLVLIHIENVFFDVSTGFGHRSYLLKKESGLAHHSV